MHIKIESLRQNENQNSLERNWMNPEMQTTLLNTYLPKLIAKILEALRQQLKEKNQLQMRRLQAQYQKSLLSLIKS